MSNGDGEGSSGEGFSTQVGVESGEFLDVEVVEFGFDHGFGVDDVLSEEVLGDDLEAREKKEVSWKEGERRTGRKNEDSHPHPNSSQR